MTDVHLINHTHWDREWFLTHEYTTAWVAPLIDSLEARAADNPDYRYLFDGQTLAIEDLLNGKPEYRDRVAKLIGDGNLEIGPCYSQPDWRIVSGELHVRNMQYGLADAESLGGSPETAWLVDTFGHISQAPQLLSQMGMTAAYVWRGVPAMVPVFRWRSPDGTELTTIDLFGGYRNLYGITKTPDIAVQRLIAEADKLAPSYDGLPVPLFDGYDLDSEPEDPARYYAELDVPDRIRVHASSPGDYAAAIADHASDAQVIDGELLSGKYGSTFPGSLSARTYLKVLHHDCEIALHRRIEPLAVMARAAGAAIDTAAYEQASRELLQNGVHDCICGVSIDQVHERMERSYRRMIAWADTTQRELASAALSGFAPGHYAIATHAVPTTSTVRADGQAVRVATTGIGVSPIVSASPVEAVDEVVETFEWVNDHYRAAVDASGISVEDCGRLARLIVRSDDGDTYSSEPGEVLGELTATGDPVIVDRSDVDTTVRSAWQLASGDITVAATIDARFDDGPNVDLTIHLASTGTEFRVDAAFETGIEGPTVRASMPFDVVERPHDDNDLLGQEIDPALAGVLMGQRETGWVTEFPFHDFVATSDGSRTRAVLAQGLRSYRSSADGTIQVALRRSAEWLAKTGLELRSGDAGPAMYVPGGRCERTVEHRVGFTVLSGDAQPDLLNVNEVFKAPPVIVEVTGDAPEDAPTDWTLFSAPFPVTACVPGTDGAIVRLYNPHSRELAFDVDRVDLRGNPLESSAAVRSKEIVTTHVSVPALTPGSGEVKVLSPILCRAPQALVVPNAPEMDDLGTRIAELEGLLSENATARAKANGGVEGYFLTHTEYVLDRERLELALSLELNRRRAATDDEVSIPDDPDPVIAEIGADLNDLRIKRRIYDYVVQALGSA